ncbi:MAG: SRPBCC family protein [Microlunatus sp.]
MTTPPQDPTALAGATVRQVVPTEVDGLPARVVTATRIYRGASIDDVWDALTNAERLPRWFLPVSGDLRLGGRYQLEGNAGGQVQTCEPPRLFEVTWEAMGATSWLAVELSPVAAGTQLELRHTQHSDHDFWRQFGPGATGVGWDLSLVGLELHLAAADQLDPAEFEAWSITDAGKVFVTASAQGWAEADIAGGADPEAAGSAGRNTAAFYRGEASE